MKTINFFKTAISAVCVLFSSYAYSQWGLSGNAVGASDWLGGNNTTTNPFIIKSYGFERIRILSNNSAVPRIGINNSAPSLAVDLMTNSTNDGIRIINSGTTAAALNLQSNDVAGHRWALFSAGSGNSQGAGNFSIYDYTAGADRLFINTSGNVGIGTTTPLGKLHVNNGLIRITGTNSLGGPMLIFGDGSSSPNNGQWGLEYVPSSSGTPGLNFWRPWPTSNAGNYFLFLADNTGNVGINTNNATARLTVNGNVLIGDPASVVNLPAGYKLYVETGILTEKVKVAIKTSTNWSDYVFAKDYQLNKLEDVEKYVMANGHLPNIPSADEVVKDGIDMATMDAKLLEKIEELTLYMIEMKKENNNNIDRIKELQEQVKQLSGIH